MTDPIRSKPSETARFCAAGATDVGRKRKHNEDTILCRPDLGLFLVADGMGGHSAGDIASALAAESIEQFFEDTEVDWAPGSSLPDYPDIEPSAARLVLAIRCANDDVVAASLENAARKGMGTTIVAVHLSPDGMIHIAHVGDSRCYRIGTGDIEQVTQDHSFINNVKWSQPSIGDDVMAAIPKNIITRALGTKDAVEVEVRSEMTLPGDTYLLCSDGLSGMVAASDIQRVVECADDPQQACKELIARANRAGGKDNISVVTIRIDERREPAPSTRSVSYESVNSALRYDQTIGSWLCSNCGHEYVDGTVFCVECGTAFLPNCETGETNPPR